MTKKQVVERRKHKRIQVERGAFVGVGPHFEQVGPLIDISMDGLSFRYLAGEKHAKGLSLDIFMTDRDYYLGYVPFKVVSDSKTRVHPSGCLTTRRCCVKFGGLTESQMSRLEDFIEKHSINEI